MKLRNGKDGTGGRQPGDGQGAQAKKLRSTAEVQLITQGLERGERGAVLAMIDLPTQEGGTNQRYAEAELVADLAVPLVYFERLDVPNGLLHGRPRSLLETDALEAHVQRSFVDFGKDGSAYPALIPFMVYQKLNARDPGGWAIWEQDGQALIPGYELEPGLGFRLDLQRAFIVPSRALPVDDILAFRRRYREDLTSLRLHIDELCAKIAANGLDRAAIRTEIERFDSELARYTKTVAGWNNRKAVADLSISMNWTKAFAAAGATTVAATALPIELPVAAPVLALLGAAAAGLKIETTAGLKREETRSPFRYFGAIRHELD
ncbi:DUF6236 family protein [Caulobacter hibisci]|uniref:Uncharacterized protein n=1 Tax=Caulobacter hibisci TaxID=2035993 RepID=A0ABS0SSS2_9CAUL|nr:DUF6236 family protein [Caulobacter hibisci]MBI1682692.1 hypothetical protein [Caulobacter hibisci]